MSTSPQDVFRKLVNSVLLWRKTRIAYRQILDKKSAKQVDVDRAKTRLLRATDDLEKAASDFEKMFKAQKSGLTPRSEKVKIPWGAILTGVVTGAGAFVKAVDGMQTSPGSPPQTPIRGPIIDVEGETVVVEKP